MHDTIRGVAVELGDAHGYCYQPRSCAKNSTIINMSLLPTGLTVQPHPIFDTAGEAIEWLAGRGVKGDVIRGVHHYNKVTRQRMSDEAVEFIDTERDYKPWFTDHVVAVVDFGLDYDEWLTNFTVFNVEQLVG